MSWAMRAVPIRVPEVAGGSGKGDHPGGGRSATHDIPVTLLVDVFPGSVLYELNVSLWHTHETKRTLNKLPAMSSSFLELI